MKGHAIIAGYGVPGRAVAEWMNAHGIPFVVIEQNQNIVDRCSLSGTVIIAGNVADEETLRKAEIETASILILAVPVEAVVLAAVPLVRRLNAKLRIVARCTYISGGLEATKRGADDAIVAEEIVAEEFVRRLDAAPLL